VVPCHRWSETNSQGVVIPHSDVRHAYFLPERLDVTGKIDAEERARGIFSVQVYALDLALRGAFARPDFAALGISAEDADWSKAEVAVGISDVRAIQSTPSLTWAGEERPFVPGAQAGGLAENGIHVDVPLGPTGREIEFAFPLRLHGSEGVWFVPFARETVAVESPWPSPSFQGSWLPSRREVSAPVQRGWSIPTWDGTTRRLERRERADQGDRGVALRCTAGRAGRPAPDGQRSVSTGLFILLTFAAIWLIEVLAQLRVHPIQYLLIGGALGLFFLLELRSPSTWLRARLPVGERRGGRRGRRYAWAVLARPRRALAVAGMVGAVYGYLYVLLTAEDFALLFGSVGLFAVLSAFMWLTRRIDWYQATAPKELPGEA
jgi:inner membrane protein